MPLAFRSRETASEGCAPLPSQALTFSSSSSIVDGSVWGSYRPTISRNLPSRGEWESAATTRYIGFFLEPTRVSLSLTAIAGQVTYRRLRFCFLRFELGLRVADRAGPPAGGVIP